MPRWRYTVFRPCPFVLLRTTNITNKNYNANNLPKKQDFFLKKKDFCKYNYIRQLLNHGKTTKRTHNGERRTAETH